MSDVRNGVYVKHGLVEKRAGYGPLDRHVLASGSDAIPVLLSGIRALGSRQGEPLAFTSDRCYSFSSGSGRWIDRGPVRSVVLEDRRTLVTPSDQFLPSFLRNGGIETWAWEDSRGGIRVSVSDAETGVPYVHDRELTTTPSAGAGPVLVPIGNDTVLIYVDGDDTSIRSFRINPGNPYVTLDDGPYTLAGDALATVMPAAKPVSITDGDRAVFAYADANSVLRLGFVDSRGKLSGSLTTPSSDAVTYVSGAISIAHSPEDDQLWVAANSGSGDDQHVVVHMLSDGLIDVSGTMTFGFPSGSKIERMASCFGSGEQTDRGYHLWVEMSASVDTDHMVHQLTASISQNSVLSGSSTHVHAGLASEAWSVDSGSFVTIVHPARLGPSHLVVDSSGSCHARLDLGTARGLHRRRWLPTVSTDPQGRAFLPTNFKNRPDVELTSSLVFNEPGIRGNVLGFMGPDSHVTAQLDGTTYMAGAVVKRYDGDRWFEVSFHSLPEIVSGSFSSGSDGRVEGSTGSYRLRWESFDVNGRRELGPAYEFVSRMPYGNNQVTFTVAPPPATDRTRVSLAVFRTLDDAEVPDYFRVDDPSSPTIAPPGSASFTFTDNVNNTTLAGRERDPGNAEWLITPPRPARVVHASGDRIWLAGLDDDRLVHHSKVVEPGQAAHFSEELALVNEEPVTAVAELDQGVVVFSRDNVRTSWGQGPSDSFGDVRGLYGTPRLVPSFGGARSQRGLVIVPNGAMFVSDAKGILQIDRGGRVSYPGSNVEAFNALDIRSADAVPGTNLVLFLTRDGECMAFDHFFGRWAVYDNHLGIDACTTLDPVTGRGTYQYLRTDGRDVYRRDPNRHDDAGAWVSLVNEFGWMTHDNLLSGVKAVRHVYCQIDYFSAHTLELAVAYDFRNEFTAIRTFDTVAELAITGLGDEPFGSGSFGGIPSGTIDVGTYPLRGRVRRRARGYKLRIRDLQPTTGGFGRGYSLVSAEVEVIRLPGRPRINDAV